MTDIPNAPVLPFSGERFTPECVREMAYEHWHRYALASTMVNGCRVLDGACGEGYGSALMAQQAQWVDGVDVNADAILHARSRYRGDNLRFLNASVTRIPVKDNAYDAVISFETVEHLTQQSQMLAEFARVLDDRGFLLISSPDKATYSDATGYVNEHHVKELYRDELLSLLKSQFPVVKLMGQAMSFQSLLWPLEELDDHQYGPAQSLVLESDSVSVGHAPAAQPLYFLALCAKRPSCLPALPVLSSFSDRCESVYAHYQHEIRKNMAAGQLLAERDAEIEDLRAALALKEAE